MIKDNVSVSKRKIGIMGGTFDPPHLGHLLAAEISAETLGLEKVIFVPTGKIPYKDSSRTSSAADRFNMTRLAISSNNPLFDICGVETENDDYSYTCDTLEKLNGLYPNSHLFFIVGADSLDYMERWREPERIFSLCSVIAVSREGFSADVSIAKKNELLEQFGADIHLISMPNIAISSSLIRKRAASGKSVRYMVPRLVADYIVEKGLYTNHILETDND